jgi:hypothetical protein
VTCSQIAILSVAPRNSITVTKIGLGHFQVQAQVTRSDTTSVIAQVFAVHSVQFDC